MNNYHLIISCPDRRGIVAAVSQFIAEKDGNIIEADQHTDVPSQWFFMRYEISLALSNPVFDQQFAPIAKQFGMHYHLRNTQQKPRVLVLVSRESHCLEDLLYRHRNQELDCEIVAVASNHKLLADRVAYDNIPFHHIPIAAGEKAAHFAKIQQLIDDLAIDVTVLARYMQILPTAMCERYAGKIINIHHSFLPSFIGANPYAQAYARGVKLIGATSHYVTAELDEGPIIEQDVIRISHRETLASTIRKGKDVERMVLARALQAHLADRVILHGCKTVVF